MAYAMSNHLLCRLRKFNIHVTENQLRDALDKMQISLIQTKGNRFYLRSKMPDEIKNIINKLGLKQLPNILPEAEIFRYI